MDTKKPFLRPWPCVVDHLVWHSECLSFVVHGKAGWLVSCLVRRCWCRMCLVSIEGRTLVSHNTWICSLSSSTVSEPPTCQSPHVVVSAVILWMLQPLCSPPSRQHCQQCCAELVGNLWTLFKLCIVHGPAQSSDVARLYLSLTCLEWLSRVHEWRDRLNQSINRDF